MSGGQRHVLVVGAGIIGCSTAFHLARRGVRVTVLDKENNGQGEGSFRSMGSLRVQGRQPPELPLAADALELWKEWSENYNFEFLQGGNMYVAENESELPAIEEYEAQAHQMGLSLVKMLTPDEAKSIVPFVPGAIAGALYSPVDAQCNPPLAVQTLARMAQTCGAEFRYNERVTEVQENRGAIEGVITATGKTLSAQTVILAGGVWTPLLASQLGISVPIKEVLSTQAETTAVPTTLRPTLRGFSFSARQRPGGQLILGGGLDARVDKVLSPNDLRSLKMWLPRYVKNRRSVRLRLEPRAFLDDLLHLAVAGKGRVAHLRYPEPRRELMERSLRGLQKHVGGLSDARIERVWCGFIDNTLDGLPVIERTTKPEGAIVLSGFSGHGLGIAPTVGKIAADLVITGHTTYDIEPFRSARFAEPNLAMPGRFV